MSSPPNIPYSLFPVATFVAPSKNHLLYLFEPVGDLSLQLKPWKSIHRPWKAWFLTFRTARHGILIEAPPDMVGEVDPVYGSFFKRGSKPYSRITGVRYGQFIVWYGPNSLVASVAPEKWDTSNEALPF